MHARIASSPNSSEYWSFSVTPSEMLRRKTLKSTKCKIAARSGLTSSSKFQAGQRLKYLERERPQWCCREAVLLAS